MHVDMYIIKILDGLFDSVHILCELYQIIHVIYPYRFGEAIQAPTACTFAVGANTWAV